MSQLPLFAHAGESVLVEDARGRIVNTPDFPRAAVIGACSDELRDGVAWEAQRRRMYDRGVDVPRLVGHFRLAPEAAPVPEAIRAAAQQVAAAQARDPHGNPPHDPREYKPSRIPVDRAARSSRRA